MNVKVEQFYKDEFWQRIAQELEKANQQIVIESFLDMTKNYSYDDKLFFIEELIEEIQDIKSTYFFNSNGSKLYICGINKSKINSIAKKHKKKYRLSSYNKINEAYFVILNKVDEE